MLALTADRIAEHAAAHRLPAVSLVLHGGEPLLAGTDRLAAFAALVRHRVPGHTRVRVTLQTNATLLTAARVRDLARARIAVGVSLDGGRARHNTARVDHAGRPSWPAALRGTRLLAEHAPEAYAGILLVVDPEQDPAEVYTSLLRLRPPPSTCCCRTATGAPRRPASTRRRDRPPAPGRRPRPVRRLARRRLRPLVGRRAQADPGAALRGGDRRPARPAHRHRVARPRPVHRRGRGDRRLPRTDRLAQVGLPRRRRHRTHPRPEHLRRRPHPPRHRRPPVGPRRPRRRLPRLPLLHACGGGHYAHRHRAKAGFGHPSVYCADQQRFLHHVAAALARATGTGPARDPTTAGEGGTR
ncbi:radical SAM protein [Actinomadura keratinilytica]